MDHGQPVFHRDVERAHALFDRQRIPGAAFDGGIVGAHDDLAAGHDAEADDGAGARRVAAIGHVRCERGEFQKRRAGIEQSGDAFARQHLSLARETVEIALRPRVPRRLLSLAEFARELAIVRVVGAELGRRRRDHGGDAAHLFNPRSAAQAQRRSRPCRRSRRRRASARREFHRAERSASSATSCSQS